jgi:hypothetical protein
MTNEEQVAAVGRALIRDGAAEKIATIEVESGPIRTFELYWATPKKKMVADEDVTRAVLTSLWSFERRRGAVISANEQPVLVGDVMVRESVERRRPYGSWTHLKHGFYWEGAALAGASPYSRCLSISWRALLGGLSMGLFRTRKAGEQRPQGLPMLLSWWT